MEMVEKHCRKTANKSLFLKLSKVKEAFVSNIEGPDSTDQQISRKEKENTSTNELMPLKKLKPPKVTIKTKTKTLKIEPNVVLTARFSKRAGSLI